VRSVCDRVHSGRQVNLISRSFIDVAEGQAYSGLYEDSFDFVIRFLGSERHWILSTSMVGHRIDLCTNRHREPFGIGLCMGPQECTTKAQKQQTPSYETPQENKDATNKPQREMGHYRWLKRDALDGG
jgi:hypothetical protein